MECLFSANASLHEHHLNVVAGLTSLELARFRQKVPYLCPCYRGEITYKIPITLNSLGHLLK